MKVLRNVVAPIIGVLVYVVALFIGIRFVDFISGWELNEITYQIQRSSFNPYMYVIGCAVLRTIVLDVSIVASSWVSAPTQSGFKPGAFAFALIAFCFSAFALVNIITSLIENVTFEYIVYLIEELIKAALSACYAIWGLKDGSYFLLWN